jgi:regulator of protease activity HflC (stomatin/prohibitin superfamily)
MLECNCKCASIIFISIWCLVVFLTSLLVSVSFSVLEINQAGVRLDTINFLLEENSIYLAGRHWLGLGKEFKVYPLDYQTIEFSQNKSGLVITRTSDPLQIYIEAAVTYKLRSEFLLELYNRFPNMDYEYALSNVTKGVIMNTAQSYSLDDFFTKRGVISENMANNINIEFRNIFVELEFFELKQIILDEPIEKVIVNAMVALNNAEVQKGTLNIETTQGQIEKLQYDTLSNITSIMSSAYKNSNISIAQTEANALASLMRFQSSAYKKFLDSFGLAFTQKELSKLLYYMHIDETTFFSEDFSQNKDKIPSSYGLDNYYLLNNK